MSNEVDTQVLKERMTDLREDVEHLCQKVDGLTSEVHSLVEVWREQAAAIDRRLGALEDLAETGKALGKAALKRGLPLLAALLGAVAMGGETLMKAIAAAIAP